MKKILIILLMASLMACTDKAPDNQDDSDTQTRPVVVTSNYPLYFFASQIAGDQIDVRFPSIDGDPAMWVPGGDDLAMLQRADLLILNGAGYESWLAFTSLQGDNILDTTATVETMLLPIEEATVHQHGPQGEHSHEGTAFTTWLDPKLATEQARTILQGLSNLKPDQSGLFNANFTALEQGLYELDRSLARAFAALDGQPVIYSHPVYQYLQRRYNINGRSLHWEPDVEPGTRDWIDLGNLVRQHPAKLMIWEGEPTVSVREKLTQMGVRSVVFSPAGNQPGEGDYFEIMNDNIAEFMALF